MGNATALIVDDDRAIQRLLADALTREGFTVLVEKDGEWAVKTFEQKQVDIILLDLLLPAINGFEVARRIRMLPKGKTVPIVFVSGIYKSSAHKQDAVNRYQIHDFLDKPINMKLLYRALKTALGDRYPSKEVARKEREAVDAAAPEPFADITAQQEVAEVEEVSKVTRLPVTVRGNFAQRPFPELLAELYRWRATGALLLRREKVKKIVFFREGRPYFIKSNLLSECLGKIMVREKMISEEECEESLKRMKGSGRQQGTVLIEMGCISPHNLVYGLSMQLQTKLYDIFAWNQGDYQFNPKAELPSEATTLDVTTAAIIYEGVRRTFDEARLAQVMPDVENLYVHPSADPLYRFQEIGMDEEEIALLTAIDGHKTVATLSALALLPPLQTLQFIYAMKCAQMVDLTPESAAGPVEVRFKPVPGEGAPEPPPIPSRPAGSGWQKSIPPTPAPKQPVMARAAASLLPELSGLHGIPGGAPEERDLRERLAQIATQFKRMDYFQILGIQPQATKDEIKRAYFGLAKEYHPDKHFGTYSAEIRNLAAEIFDLVTTAHDTLTDQEDRERYLAELAKGVKKEVSDAVSKILAAEGKFQKGDEMLRKRSYREAHQLFDEAVSLYPEEGEFHAYLGWALFQMSPRDEAAAQKAMDHIETAIRLNPRLDKSYLFLGYIYKATGRPDKAEKQFEKAIQCNPDCVEALRELRILGKGRR
jgi:DNA-binding response OmpR family regulator/curved DNA-binding protein CbpA